MDALSELRKINSKIEILSVVDKDFLSFGRVLTEAKADLAINAARGMWKVTDGIGAAASVPEFEADKNLQTTIGTPVFAEMPIEVGWVYGRNDRLNGLEWHHGSEVHIPLEDCVFLLANWLEIQWSPKPSIDTKHILAFYAPKGTIVELKNWALHFVPINVSKKTGFCNLFVLLRGTAEPLQMPKSMASDHQVLIARNQWLIVHPKAADLVKAGNHVGIYGENITINQLD